MKVFSGILLLISAAAANGSSGKEYVTAGDKLLNQGEIQSAIKEYDSAIKLEPENYLYLFKRSAAYLSVGKDTRALEDINEVLKLQPEFEGALTQRGRILIQRGKYDEASETIKKLTDKKNESKRQEMDKIISDTQKAWKEAERALKNNDYVNCEEFANQAVENSPKTPELRRIRKDCKLKNGNLRGALVDLSHLQNLNPEESDNYIKSAKISFYAFYEYDKALQTLRRCLQFDPDNKSCIQANKQIRKLEKQIKDFSYEDVRRKKASGHAIWDNVLTSLESEGLYDKLKQETSNEGFDSASSDLINVLNEALCDAHYYRNHYKQGIKYCDLTRPDYIQGILLRANGALNVDEDPEEAVRILRDAIENHDVKDSKIQSKLREAQIELKKSKNKDYYKILGVSKTADEKDIKKAYRTQTKEYHPDKYKGDLTEEQIMQKMADINEAYEVLSDPEKRHQYDNGQFGDDDGQFGGYDSRFQQGHPFGHGGFDFAQFGKQFHFQFQH